jgi:regulator of replication initiation timing
MEFNDQTLNFIAVCNHITFGYIIGMVTMKLLNTCRIVNSDKKKIDELQDIIEEITECNEDLKIENDNLTADAAADQMLIDKLKHEVRKLNLKTLELETQILDYESAMIDVCNTAIRNRKRARPSD